ncbi:MAG: hypothetical protein NC453_10875 [Muribaculum sp.]|nr:hypothetical protein [Muribaculum sp.]
MRVVSGKGGIPKFSTWKKICGGSRPTPLTPSVASLGVPPDRSNLRIVKRHSAGMTLNDSKGRCHYYIMAKYLDICRYIVIFAP